MEENKQDLNIAKNENSKPKKKSSTLKIVLVLIIAIMAIIIGILSWLLISGKDFSNIFKNNVEQSEDREKGKEVYTDNSKNDGNEKDMENKDKETESNINGHVSGNGPDDILNKNLKESFKVTYETRGVRNITIEGSSFVCNENVPHITGISEKAAKNMEKTLNDWYIKTWKDINAQTKDDYIKEILNQMNENSKKYNSIPEDIGFNQSYNVIYLTNKIVTFEHVLQGGLGGVSWGSTGGVSFDLETGNVIEIKDVVTSKEKYIEACKKTAFEQLEKDSRYGEVIQMHKNDYQGIINSAIENIDGYFTKDGIVCAEIPKYSIASGASGEFKFVIPYDLAKNYINNKYIENTGNSIQENSNNKESYTQKELEKMALDYYEAKTGYRPGNVASQLNNDGTVSIQLYDNMGDHNSTSDWYTVDIKTAVGTNVIGDKIDLKNK